MSHYGLGTGGKGLKERVWDTRIMESLALVCVGLNPHTHIITHIYIYTYSIYCVTDISNLWIKPIKDVKCQKRGAVFVSKVSRAWRRSSPILHYSKISGGEWWRSRRFVLVFVLLLLLLLLMLLLLLLLLLLQCFIPWIFTFDLVLGIRRRMFTKSPKHLKPSRHRFPRKS